MLVELEFLDSTRTRVNEESLTYKDTAAIPNVGDRVSLENSLWVVSKRDFIYLSGDDGFPDLVVSCWVEPRT
ncbi:hypothetical protein V8134_004219 [Vibrio vulnificus]